jgi:membrane fusion protein, multidrug efflux system
VADHRDRRRHRLRPGRLIAPALVVAAVAAGMPSAIRRVDDRRTHSITDDAFVEAHIVNVAPQLVSGRIVRFLAEEDDRVVQGQILAEIDSIPYRDEVNVARAQLDSALAELDRQRADLSRTRKEVPIQVEIARRTFASVVAERARAEESLKLTEDDVEKGIDEARAELKADNADLVLALADHARIANLEGRGSATRQELDQMVRTRDASRAHVEVAGARLARALSARTQVDLARRALEAAQKSEQKAAKGIELAEVGFDEIREIELLVRVKERSADQARQALESAENDLAYTLVRARFPGVVVKRYRPCRPAHQCITYPPSTLIVWPVMFRPRLEARNTAMAATSSGSCQRFRGTSFRILSADHSS